MNLVPGAVAAGTFQAGPIRYKLAAGDGPATVALRAEDAALVAAGTPNSFSGKVIRLVDLGAFRTMQVEIGTEEPLKVRLPKGGALAEGDTVHLLPLSLTFFRPGEPPIEFADLQAIGRSRGAGRPWLTGSHSGYRATRLR